MADNQIQDPITPAFQMNLQPLPKAPDVTMSPLIVGGGPQRPPQEGLLTGGTTPLNTLPNTGRYPVFFRGIDNEEAYAQGQTVWNKFTRDTVKLGGLALGTFVDGTVGSVYGLFKAIHDGKFSSFYNNEVTNAMDEFNKNLENQFANYYTKKELEADWYEPDNLLTANFWLDKVYKNLGFAAGAIGSGAVWAKALRGLGLFSKVASVGNAAKAADITEQAVLSAPASQRLSAIESGLAKVAKDFATQYNVRNTAQRAVHSLIMTSGEAAIEALEGMNTFRTELVNQFIQENGRRPEVDEMKEINSVAESVGNTRFLLNTALLSATNYIQLPKIIGSKYKAEKSLFNDLVQPINKIKKTKEGIYEAVQPTRLERVLSTRKFFFSGSEAFEEGAQYAIESGVSNYWNKKYSGEETSFVDDLLVKGVGETLSTKEGLESILIGGLSGAAMQARGRIQEDRAKRVNTQQAVAAFNSSYVGSYLKDAIDNYNRGVKLQQERKEAIEKGDFFSAKELELDFMHSYLAPRVKWGRFDLVNEEINDLKQLISASPEGFDELVSSGKIPEGVTKEEALANLNRLQENAKAMSNAYETLNIRYAGLINEDGKRVYSEDTIDKMVYANTKIQDYDRRIPALQSRLAGQNLDINDALDAITEYDVPTKETINGVLAQIDKLNTTDEVKDQLKEDFVDLLEMSQRRQEFIKEYNDMKKNPEDYEDIDSGVRFEPEFEINVKGKTFGVGKSYALESPYMTTGQFGGLSLFPEIRVTGLIGNQVRVQLPNGRETYITKKQLSRYVDSFEGENPYKTRDKEIDKALSELSHPSLPANFKDLSLDEKVAAINASRSTKLQNEAKAAIDNAVEEFKKQRDEELKILQNEQLNTQIETSQKDIASQAGDPPFEGEVDSDVINEPESAKPHISRIAHTTYNAKEKKAYNDREQNLFNTLDKLSDEERAKFKVVPVTKANEATFGLTGVVDEALAGYTPPAGEEAILFVYVKKDGKNWYFTDVDGKNLHQIEKDKPAPKDKVVYGMATNSKIEGRYFGQGQENFQKAWEQARKEMLASTKFTPYDFEVSRGIPQKESGSRKPITSVLSKDINLSKDGLVVVATTGPIIMPSGEGVNVPFGRPFFKQGSNLLWADDRQLLPKEKENIKQLLKNLTTTLTKKPAEWDKLITSYLQGLLFFSPPYDAKGNKKKVSPSQIWFEKGQWVMGKEEKKIPFLASSFDNPTYTAILDEFLDSLYVRVNNTKLNQKQKFAEITGFDEKGEPTVKMWNSYQEFLISPEGRTPSEIPLTTSVSSIENRYSWLPSITQNVKIVEEKPAISEGLPVKQPSKTPDGFKTVGEASVQELLGIGPKAQEAPKQQPTAQTPTSRAGMFDRIANILANNMNATVQGTEATQSEPVEPQQPIQVKPDSSNIEAKKAGIEEVFNLNPELSKIGNKEQYSQYLDTIFPNSQVKDIVYHGSDNKFDSFLEDNLNYFGTKEIAKGYGRILYPVVIEINKPYYEDGGNLSNQSYEDLYDKLDESNSDGFISNGKNLFVPKSEEQIHILGSKQDIEGFRKFVGLENKTQDDKRADIERRRKEELNKEFGRNIELVKSGQKAVISRTPDLVKLSSDPQVADSRAQEVIDKYNTINAKYDTEADIERRREEELINYDKKNESKAMKEFAFKRINAKYDAELAALESPKTEETKTQDSSKADFLAKLAAAKKAKEEGKGPASEAQNKIVNTTNYVVGDMQKEKEYISERLNVPVTVVQNLIDNLQGGYSWGQFRDAAIYLYEKAEVGTGYHEAFEAVWAMFTSLQEKKNILSEFRGRGGSFTDRETGKSIKYSEATEYQAKEELAEEFSRYIQNGTTPPKAKKNLIQRFFAALKNFIQNVILGRVTTPEEFFKRIDSGYYKNAPIVKSSTFNTVANKIPGLGQLESHSVIKGVAAKVFQEIFSDASTTSLIEFEESNASVDEIFDAVYEKLDNFYNGETGLLNYLADQNMTEDEIYSIWKVWDTTKENWPEVVQLTKEYLTTFSIVSRTLDENNQIVEREDSVEINKEGEDTQYDGKSDSYVRDVFKLDAKQNAPMSVKLLFATIVDSQFGEETLEGKTVVAKRDNATAMEQMVQYAKLFNNTLAELVSFNTPQEKFDKIKELADKHPNYVRVVKRLELDKSADNVAVDTWKMQIKAFSTFSKQRPTAYIYTIDAEGNAYSMPANQADTVRTIVQSWLDTMKLKASKPNSFVTFNQAKKRFEFDPKVIDRISVGTKEQRIEFLNKLGITFTPEMLGKLTVKETENLHNSILGLHTGLKKGETIANTAASLGASKRLSTIANLFVKSQALGPESTFYNIEGERVQEFVLPNFFSNTINDINNAKDTADLYRRLPYLQQLWHQGSYYINPSKYTPKFEIEYIQGVRDISNEFNPNIPTSKLNEGMRLLQEFNQNLRGSYYALIPADSQTEWMVKMEQPVLFEGINQIGWNNFYDIIEKYYEVESELYKLDGKERLLAAFGDYANPLNRETLKQFVRERARDQVKLLMDYNLITPVKKDGTYKLTGFSTDFLEKHKIDKDKVTASEMEDLFTFRTMNYMINNIEMHKIFYGDPAAYGKIDNMTKRYKSFLSPRETSVYSSPEINAFLDDNYNKAGEIKLTQGIPGYQNYKDSLTTVTMSDVEVAGLYDESNATDAQSWATLSAYREIRQKAGFRWKQDDEIQYQYIQALDRKLMFEDGLLSEDMYPEALRKQDEKIVELGNPESAVFNPLKPIGSGYTSENNVFLDKTSVVPLSYALVRGKNAATVYKKMLDEKIDYLIVESGRKVGNTGMDTFYNEDGSVNTTPYKNTVEIPFRYYGIQVETTNPKDVQTRGSQLTKLAIINLFENGQPSNEAAAKAVERNITTLKKMAEEGYDRLLENLGIVDTGEGYMVEDKAKLLKIIRNELLRREVADNIKDALKLDPETNDFVVPLEALNNYQQIKNILFSYIDKYITSPKVSGGPKIQVSGALWEEVGVRKIVTRKGKKLLVSSGLKFYENEDGKRYIEVLLPSWMNRTLREAGLKWNTPEELMEKIKQSPDAKDILSGVGFRIPTQEINSAEVFVIKGFLPEYAGDMVVVPEEITTKAGSDFDVDKLNMYLKNVYVDSKGQIRTVKYFENMEEHDAYYKQEFKNILEARFKDTVEGIEKQGKLQSLFGDLVAGNLKPKVKEKWDGIFREWFGEKASAADIEQIFMDRLSKLGKTKSQLTDMERQEILLWKFVDEMRKKSLENEYYRSIEELLTLPENFDRLTTPNSTKTLTAIRKTLVDINEEEFGEGSVKSILNPMFMSRVRHNFIVGKGGVGIAAVAQTGTAVRQQGTVYIDPSRKNLVPDPKDRQDLGDAIVRLPHNKVTINGISYTSLSGKKDRAGQYISDKNSEYINGYVDIAKDAFIVQIGATVDQAGTFLFLEGIGVPSETVAYFMNQPIIREYLKAWKLREKGEFKTDVLEAVARKFPTKEAVPKDFSTKNIKELNSKLLNNITKYYKTNGELDNAEQHFILKEYLKYVQLSKQVFTLTQGSNYDTSNFSDSNLVIRKRLLEKKARTQTVISSVDTVLNSTFLGDIRNAVVKGTAGIGSIFKFTSPKVMKALAPTIEELTRNIYSQSDFLKAARKIEVSLIDYLVQNSSKLNNNIARLVLNEQTSVALELSNIKELKGDIANNVVLQELVPLAGSQPTSPKNVKLINKAYDVFTSNLYTEALRELRDNPHTQTLYGNLIRLAFLQSGISRSAISFTENIPVEDFAKVLQPAIDAVQNEEMINNFLKTDAFYRNNWRDDKIVPIGKDRVEDTDFGGDFGIPELAYDGGGFPVEYKDRFVSTDVLNLFGENVDLKDFKMWRVHENARNFNAKFLKVRVNDPRFSSKEKKEMAQAGDFSFMKTYFLKRVEHTDGTPATIRKGRGKYAIFVPTYAWGNGMNLQEYYSDIRPSVSDNNTYKPPRELNNTEIINALGINKPDGKTIFDAALTPSQPLIEEEMENVSEINIYAGTNENADLSNFAIRPFKFQVQPIVSTIYGEKSFDSVEQAFQWHKGLFAEAPAQFGGSGSKTVQIMRQIKETQNGADIKKLGRQYILKNTKAWDKYSPVLMKDLLKASFEQNQQALQRLLSTGNAKLTHTQDKGKWGTEFPKLLMEVRDELRKNSSDINPENQINEDCN